MRVIKNSVVFGDTVLPAPLIVGVEVRRAFSFHTLLACACAFTLGGLAIWAFTTASGVDDGHSYARYWNADNTLPFSKHTDDDWCGFRAIALRILSAILCISSLAIAALSPSRRLVAFLLDGRRVPGPVFFLAANARIAKNLLLTELANVEVTAAIQEATPAPKPSPAPRVNVAPPLPERAKVAPATTKIHETHVERQVVVSRCKFCNKLTPVDADTCSHCGAANFLR